MPVYKLCGALRIGIKKDFFHFFRMYDLEYSVARLISWSVIGFSMEKFFTYRN